MGNRWRGDTLSYKLFLAFIYTLNNGKAKEYHSNYLKVIVASYDLLHISECLWRKHDYSGSLLLKAHKNAFKRLKCFKRKRTTDYLDQPFGDSQNIAKPNTPLMEEQNN